MADSQRIVDVLRHAYRQWDESKGGSARTWIDLFAPEIAIRTVGSGASALHFAEKRQGMSEGERYFEDLARDWEMIHYNAHEFIAEGDRVVVLCRVSFRFRATGKVVETPKVDVFRFRDGKIVEFFESFDSAAAAAATRPD